jgi:hypothetical protein
MGSNDLILRYGRFEKHRLERSGCCHSFLPSSYQFKNPRYGNLDNLREDDEIRHLQRESGKEMVSYLRGRVNAFHGLEVSEFSWPEIPGSRLPTADSRRTPLHTTSSHSRLRHSE